MHVHVLLPREPRALSLSLCHSIPCTGQRVYRAPCGGGAEKRNLLAPSPWCCKLFTISDTCPLGRSQATGGRRRRRPFCDHRPIAGRSSRVPRHGPLPLPESAMKTDTSDPAKLQARINELEAQVKELEKGRMSFEPGMLALSRMSTYDACMCALHAHTHIQCRSQSALNGPACPSMAPVPSFASSRLLPQHQHRDCITAKLPGPQVTAEERCRWRPTCGHYVHQRRLYVPDHHDGWLGRARLPGPFCQGGLVYHGPAADHQRNRCPPLAARYFVGAHRLRPARAEGARIPQNLPSVTAPP